MPFRDHHPRTCSAAIAQIRRRTRSPAGAATTTAPTHDDGHRTTGAGRRFALTLAMGAVLAVSGAACGGHPSCDPHPCPSWSRLDPYTCACVDLDSAQASEALGSASAPACPADGGATGCR